MRGSLDIPRYLHTVHITPCEPYEPLQRAIREQLITHKVNLVSYSSPHITTLQLTKPTSNEEVLAVGSSGEVQRYTLSVSASYILKGKDLQIQGSVTRSRELSRSNNMLLSNESEAQIVKRELLNEVVTEILRQITTRPSNKDNQS